MNILNDTQLQTVSSDKFIVMSSWFCGYWRAQQEKLWQLTILLSLNEVSSNHKILFTNSAFSSTFLWNCSINCTLRLYSRHVTPWNGKFPHSFFQNAINPYMLIPVWRPHLVRHIYLFGDGMNFRNTTSDEARSFHTVTCARTRCTLPSDLNMWRISSVVLAVGGSVINARRYCLWAAHTSSYFH